MMLALMKDEAIPGYKLKRIKIPMPNEGEVLVKSFSTSICGSDKGIYKWTTTGSKGRKLPFIPGHECAGLVVKLGANCKLLSVNDRVAIENHMFCDECYLCKINRGDICKNLNQFGLGKGTIYGGSCEYFLIKEKYCYKIQSNVAELSWRNASLLEPMGVAYNAINNLLDLNNNNLDLDERILIIGSGTIGCFIINILCNYFGYRNVATIDVIDWKLKIAKTVGAKYIFNEIQDLMDNIELNRYGFDKLIECTGNIGMLNKTFDFIRKGGKMVWIGMYNDNLNVSDINDKIIRKSIQIKTIHGRRIWDTWQKCETLMNDTKIKENVDKIVSHYLPLYKYEEGYKALLSGKAMKVVFDVTKIHAKL